MDNTPSTPTENKKEAAHARGEAEAFTKIGVAGAAGWGAIELCPLLELVPPASDITITAVKRNKWAALGAVAGATAIGGLAYAAYKYSHASKLEAERAQAAHSEITK
jgi:hypothetical protein